VLIYQAKKPTVIIIRYDYLSQTNGSGTFFDSYFGSFLTFNQALFRHAIKDNSVSSRSLAPGKACPSSRRQSLPACRSTLNACFLASVTWRRPRRICEVSSGVSQPGSSPSVGSAPHCLSAAGMSLDRHISGDRPQERNPHADPVIMLGRRKAHAQRRR
jgi:hypothetical protein